MGIGDFALLFLLWAVLHSLLAAIGAKRSVRARIGEPIYLGWYRLFYNLFALVTFMPVYVMVASLPGRVLWQWQQPLVILAFALQLIGLIGLLVSLWVTDIWHFIGLRQAVWYLRGQREELPSPTFVSRGPYALVRHPLYFFSLLYLWFNPVMTVASFIFYTAITVYFWVGSIYEERRLAAHFGQAYQDYRQRVPRLLPRRLRP